MINENNEDLQSPLITEEDKEQEEDKISEATIKKHIRNKNIHYFYNSYIRPLDVTAYLAKK